MKPWCGEGAACRDLGKEQSRKQQQIQSPDVCSGDQQAGRGSRVVGSGVLFLAARRGHVGGAVGRMVIPLGNPEGVGSHGRGLEDLPLGEGGWDIRDPSHPTLRAGGSAGLGGPTALAWTG